MKKKLSIIICCLFLLILISCGKEKQVISNQYSKQLDSLVSIKSLLPLDTCKLYYKQQERLYETMIQYFNDSLYPKTMGSIQNSSISSCNAKFMAVLRDFVNEARFKKGDQLATQNIFFPIFTLEKGKIGGYGFPEWDGGSSIVNDISLEYKLIEKTGYVSGDKIFDYGKTKYFTNIFDSLYENKSKTFFIYTDKGQKQGEVYDLAYYFDECISYFYYPIKSNELSSSDKPLIGSIFPIDLEYKNFPKVDTLIRAQVKPQCFDCPNSYHLAKTFAKIKGVDDLFFVFTDTYLVKEDVWTPFRGLIMRMPNDKFVYLWYEEIDLFGCMCL